MTTHPNLTSQPNPAHRNRGWFFRAISATQMGVALIVLLVLVLAWASVFEGYQGRAAVEHYVYHSWWFFTILSLMFVNVFGAMLMRLPWSRHQLEFLVTHAGLLILLLGMTVSLVDTVEGTVVLQRGMKRNSIALVNRSQLSISRVGVEGRGQVKLPFPDVAIELTPDVFDAGAEANRIAVRVVEFHAPEVADAAMARKRDQSRAAPHATALIELQGDARTQRVWLERNGDARTVQIDDSELLLELSSRRMTLGFSVELLEFWPMANPGGYGIASYVSKVGFVDDGDASRREANIAVNQPARHRGFTFVQADSRRIKGNKEVVTLGVTRDRVWMLKYLGVALVCLGMVLTLVKRVSTNGSAARMDGAVSDTLAHRDAEG